MVQSQIVGNAITRDTMAQLLFDTTDGLVFFEVDESSSEIIVFTSDDAGQTWSQGDDINNTIGWAGDGQVDFVYTPDETSEFQVVYQNSATGTNQFARSAFDVDSSGNVTFNTTDQVFTSYSGVSRTNPTDASLAIRRETRGDLIAHVKVESVQASSNFTVTEVWHFDASADSWTQVDDRVDENNEGVSHPIVRKFNGVGEVLVGWQDDSSGDGRSAIYDENQQLQAPADRPSGGGTTTRVLAGERESVDWGAAPNANTIVVCAGQEVELINNSHNVEASATLDETPVGESCGAPIVTIGNFNKGDTTLKVYYISSGEQLIVEEYDDELNRQNKLVRQGNFSISFSRQVVGYIQTSFRNSANASLDFSNTDFSIYNIHVYYVFDGTVRYDSLPYLQNYSSIRPIDMEQNGPTKQISSVIGVIDEIFTQTGAVLEESMGVIDDKIKAPTKQLTPIVGVSELEDFVVTKQIIPVVGIADDLSQAPAKSVSEVIGTVEDEINMTHKMLDEAISITENVELATTKSVSETISISDVVDNSVTKKLSETVGINIVFSRGGEVILTEVVGVVDDSQKKLTKIMEEFVGF